MRVNIKIDKQGVRHWWVSAGQGKKHTGWHTACHSNSFDFGKVTTGKPETVDCPICQRRLKELIV